MRYQLARNITNISDLRERQSFVVHAERRRFKTPDCKKIFEAYARIFVFSGRQPFLFNRPPT